MGAGINMVRWASWHTMLGHDVEQWNLRAATMSCRCQATLPLNAILQLWSQQVRWLSSAERTATSRWPGQRCVLP